MSLKDIQLFHSKFASLALEWFGEDNQAAFEKNSQDPHRRSLLENSGWLDRKVEYRFNSLGFRGKEFRGDVPNFCVFGDSITFGSAMPEEFLYVHHIENQTGIYCNNFGSPGGSNSTSVRLALTWLEELNPRFVIYQKTFEHRFEWIEDTTAVIYGVQAAGGGQTPTSNDQFYLHWIDSEENRIIMDRKNDMAMRWICHSLNIPLIETHIEEFFTLENDRARDLLHPGPIRHREMADKLLKKSVLYE